MYKKLEKLYYRQLKKEKLDDKRKKKDYWIVRFESYDSADLEEALLGKE